MSTTSRIGLFLLLAALFLALLQTGRPARSADQPPSRFAVAAGVIDGKLYLVGGTVNHQTALRTFQVFDPSASEPFTTLEPMPNGRFAATAAAIGKKLYVVGGYNEYQGVL